MIETLINSNKQIRYQVVLLIHFNDVQSAKTNESTMELSMQVLVLGTFFLSSLLFYFEQVAT
jgi:hypothetical protein